MQLSFAVRTALACSLGLALSGPVLAQSTTIDFSNSSLEPIPLMDGTTVVIDGNGNLQANCVLDGDTCQGISGGGAGAPVTTLTTSSGGSTATVTGSGTVGLSWGSTNSPEVCLARSTNGYANWSGIKPATGTASLSFSSTGTYALSLECYNDSGSGLSSNVTVTVEEGTVSPTTCDITSTDPNFTPDDYTERLVSWADAFYGNSFPAISTGGLSPTGSFTFSTSSSNPGLAIPGNYISIPFTPASGSNYKLEWYRAQAISARGYFSAKPADSVYVTISPCAGDFRLRDSSVPRTDPLSPSCGTFAQDGQVYYGTTGSGSQCTLEAGRTYYVNMVFASPYSGLTTTERTCADGASYCDANFGH